MHLGFFEGPKDEINLIFWKPIIVKSFKILIVFSYYLIFPLAYELCLHLKYLIVLDIKMSTRVVVWSINLPNVSFT